MADDYVTVSWFEHDCYIVEYRIPRGPWMAEIGDGYRTLWRARLAMSDHARRGLPARIVDTSSDAGGDS